jgi:hypothetical protein
MKIRAVLMPTDFVGIVSCLAAFASCGPATYESAAVHQFLFTEGAELRLAFRNNNNPVTDKIISVGTIEPGTGNFNRTKLTQPAPSQIAEIGADYQVNVLATLTTLPLGLIDCPDLSETVSQRLQKFNVYAVYPHAFNKNGVPGVGTRKFNVFRLSALNGVPNDDNRGEDSVTGMDSLILYSDSEIPLDFTAKCRPLKIWVNPTEQIEFVGKIPKGFSVRVDRFIGEGRAGGAVRKATQTKYVPIDMPSGAWIRREPCGIPAPFEFCLQTQ